MLDILPARASVLQPGRRGAAGPVGLRVRERVVGGAVSLAARAGGVEALATTLAWSLPIQPRRVRQDGSDVVWVGPERWLVFSETHREAELRERVGAAGSVADQSDSRVVFQVDGSRVRDVLAKGVSLDLHPRAFPVDAAAMTLAAHVAALLWRDDEDAFVVAVPRSFAGSFVQWLEASALEFGLEFA